MLNSCAAGVAVMNIDNGFGAGCLAHRINMVGEGQFSEPLAGAPENAKRSAPKQRKTKY
jgi:hypothetical protein